ncbi:barstar family protein [Bacillus sp. RG28]|uniref:Barstar family protein n=1 Tax=Gottfriedia endophytica TaxID=2820819 RepID=A0A940NHE2_9BACI|nr:barstar family protein [Gottfriedia endophytica]MBP0724077.1 barstar family protein [Gottfriedia endophytica]
MELWRQLLLNGSVKLFWNEEILDKYLTEISNEGFDIYTLDCSKWNSHNYHNDLAAVLEFPDYYGKNLDAFNDCLSDMTSERIGIVLEFRNYEMFAKKDKYAAHSILDIIQINAWRFLLEDENLKLIAFVHSSDPEIDFPDLGGLSAEWNPDEWLDKSRGL